MNTLREVLDDIASINSKGAGYRVCDGGQAMNTFIKYKRFCYMNLRQTWI